MAVPLSCKMKDLQYLDLGMVQIPTSQVSEFCQGETKEPLILCGLAKLPNDPTGSAYYIRIRVKHVKAYTTPNETLYYAFFATVIGRFEWHTSLNAKDEERNAVINGATILYGAVRDRIASISALAPCGPHILPTVMMNNLVPSDKPKHAPADSIRQP